MSGARDDVQVPRPPHRPVTRAHLSLCVWPWWLRGVAHSFRIMSHLTVLDLSAPCEAPFAVLGAISGPWLCLPPCVSVGVAECTGSGEAGRSVPGPGAGALTPSQADEPGTSALQGRRSRSW